MVFYLKTILGTCPYYLGTPFQLLEAWAQASVYVNRRSQASVEKTQPELKDLVLQPS